MIIHIRYSIAFKDYGRVERTETFFQLCLMLEFLRFVLWQGVMVLPMLKPILEDKNEYRNPYEFNPAHFLDDNGKFLKKENFIPFSIGRSRGGTCNI